MNGTTWVVWKVCQFAVPRAVFCMAQSAYQPFRPASGATVIIESEWSAGAAAASSTLPIPPCRK